MKNEYIIFISLVIGLIVGLIYGSWSTNQTNEFLIDSLDYCNENIILVSNISTRYSEKLNNSFNECQEILNEKNIFVKEMIDTCLDDCKNSLEESYDWCDKRVEKYKDYIEYYYTYESSETYPICSYNKYDCYDFETQTEAQTVMDYCGYDIHYLDGDFDGYACESLDYSNLNFGLLG